MELYCAGSVLQMAAAEEWRSAAKSFLDGEADAEAACPESIPWLSSPLVSNFRAIHVRILALA
jgi:hypothetical protein